MPATPLQRLQRALVAASHGGDARQLLMGLLAVYERNGELAAFVPASESQASPHVAASRVTARRPDHPPHLDPAGTDALRDHIQENGWPA